MNMLEHAVKGVLSALLQTYGAEFSGKYAASTPQELQAAWATELRAYTHDLDAIAWALRHLPERCPNPVQFRNLCAQAPRAQQQAKDVAPVRGPTPAERETLRESRDGIASGGLFAKPSADWAYLLLERHERGEYVSYAALTRARAVVDERRRIAALPAMTLPEPEPPLPDYWEPPMQERHETAGDAGAAHAAL